MHLHVTACRWVRGNRRKFTIYLLTSSSTTMCCPSTTRVACASTAKAACLFTPFLQRSCWDGFVDLLLCGSVAGPAGRPMGLACLCLDMFRSSNVSPRVQVISWANNWQNKWKYRHIPGPKPSFFLGNATTIRRKRNFLAFTDWQAVYGDVFKVFFVRQPAIVISGKLLSQLLHAHLVRLAGYSLMATMQILHLCGRSPSRTSASSMTGCQLVLATALPPNYMEATDKKLENPASSLPGVCWPQLVNALSAYNHHF